MAANNNHTRPASYDPPDASFTSAPTALLSSSPMPLVGNPVSSNAFSYASLSRNPAPDASWSTWPTRDGPFFPVYSPHTNCSRQRAPLTPPRSSSPSTRRTSPAASCYAPLPSTSTAKSSQENSKMASIHLPPISHFDLSIPVMRLPLTPPDSAMPHDSPPSITRTTPVTAPVETYNAMSAYSSVPSALEDSDMISDDAGRPHSTDWFLSDLQTNTAAHFLAEKMCEMVCYLWFSDSTPLAASRHSPRRHRSERSPHRQRSNSTTSALQFSPSPGFVEFLGKLLETTQVSLSVIVLSLHYIYRLKEKNQLTCGKPGSEFRIAVVGLMMANKFLDDNTYTNKTWSEVSGIPLDEVTTMETEFLSAVNFQLYVDLTTYNSWLRMMKGLVNVKEQEARVWQQRLARSSHRARVPQSGRYARQSQSRPARDQYPRASTRARSTSPGPRGQGPDYPFTFVAPPMSAYSQTQGHTISPLPSDSHNVDVAHPSDAARPGSKRSAMDAFSPTSATFSQNTRPMKRPLTLHVEIPNSTTQNIYTPSDQLSSFARLTLQPTSSATNDVSYSHGDTLTVPGTSTASYVQPQQAASYQPTLAAPYRAPDTRHIALPQNLYFYSLQGSGAYSNPDTVSASGTYDSYSGYGDHNRDKRATLRYQPTTYQPPAPPQASSESVPMIVQSACASPRDLHLLPPAPMLYPTQWPPARSSWSSNVAAPVLRPVVQQQSQPPRQYYSTPPYSMSQENIPAAAFANAGPPGVQFYSSESTASQAVYGTNSFYPPAATHSQSQRSSPLHYYYPRQSHTRPTW